MIYEWIHESDQDNGCNEIFSRKRLRNQPVF